MISVPGRQEFESALAARIERLDAAIEPWLPENPSGGLATIRSHLEAGQPPLRGVLLLLVAEAAAPETDVETYVPAALSMEFAHAHEVVHRQLIADEHTLPGSQSRSGAILAGDFLLARAFELLSSVEDAPERTCDCLQLFSKTCRADHETLAIAHAMDSEGSGDPADEPRGLFPAASEIGTRLATDEPRLIEAAASFGRDLGAGYRHCVNDPALPTPCQIGADGDGEETFQRPTTANDGDSDQVPEPLRRARDHLLAFPDTPARSLLEDLTTISGLERIERLSDR